MTLSTTFLETVLHVNLRLRPHTLVRRLCTYFRCSLYYQYVFLTNPHNPMHTAGCSRHIAHVKITVTTVAFRIISFDIEQWKRGQHRSSQHNRSTQVFYKSILHNYSTQVFYKCFLQMYSSQVFYRSTLHIYSTLVFHTYIPHSYSTDVFYRCILQIYSTRIIYTCISDLYCTDVLYTSIIYMHSTDIFHTPRIFETINPSHSAQT